jgi:hypothetical protein
MYTYVCICAICWACVPVCSSMCVWVCVCVCVCARARARATDGVTKDTIINNESLISPVHLQMLPRSYRGYKLARDVDILQIMWETTWSVSRKQAGRRNLSFCHQCAIFARRRQLPIQLWWSSWCFAWRLRWWRWQQEMAVAHRTSGRDIRVDSLAGADLKEDPQGTMSRSSTLIWMIWITKSTLTNVVLAQDLVLDPGLASCM